MLNTIDLLEKLEKKNFQISKFWINNSQILKLANNSGCIINSVDGIKKFYHHYFLIKKS